jgi:hypothetical protein
VSCQFQGTAPTAAGASLTDTVTATVNNIPGEAAGTASGSDSSTVLTTPTVLLTKANNAAGTGYGASEITAPGASSVPYRVVVTNNNASAGTITTLTDQVNGVSSAICPNLAGQVLQPGQSATCDFTGPVPTTATSDTAGVTLSVNGLLVSATAISTVFPAVLGTATTPPPTTAPLSTAPTTAPLVIGPGASALATTGAPTARLLAIALGLLLLGLVMTAGVAVTPRRRLEPALLPDVSRARGRRPGPRR